MNDYKLKIKDINDACDDVMGVYDEDIFDNVTKINELEQLCITIKYYSESNNLPIEIDNIKEVINYIDNTLTWLIEHQNEPDAIYQQRMDYINTKCNQSYSTITHYDKEAIIKN